MNHMSYAIFEINNDKYYSFLVLIIHIIRIQPSLFASNSTNNQRFVIIE